MAAGAQMIEKYHNLRDALAGDRVQTRHFYSSPTLFHVVTISARARRKGGGGQPRATAAANRGGVEFHGHDDGN